MLRKSGLLFSGALTVAVLPACSQTSHPSTPASLGKPVSSSAMKALIDKPRPIEVRTVASAD